MGADNWPPHPRDEGEAMTLDEAVEYGIRKHRTHRLKLYLEAILADLIAHEGLPETRRLLQWWDDHLKEFG